MALGTPVAGAAAYSAAGGTSVAPAYPTGILATDEVLLFVGQKPSTANSGTVTTPTGWTLRDSLTAAGGYGTTLGADTGNTNLRVYSWDTPVAGQTGTLSVTLGTNNVAWAFIVRVPTGGGNVLIGSADGQRTTTPTSPMTIALTDGATPTAFKAGDLAIWAMCIPTDVTTPAQFSAESITATGATFATAVELNEPDSGTGNDIGGYSAYASVTSGTSSTAPSVTATLAGTLTNVRGPVVLLRLREVRALTLDAASGSYTYTGQAATLLETKALNAEAGAFSYTGQDATLAIATPKELNAEAGTFTYTGQAATLLETNVLNAQAGSYALTGQAATLLETNVLNAQAGTFSYTGQAATLVETNNLNAQAGSFALTGQSASLTKAKALNAQAGSFTYAGAPATLVPSAVSAFNAQAGSFTYTGQNAALTKTKTLNAQAGGFIYTGQSAGLSRARAFNAQAGVFTLTGSAASLRISAYSLSAAAGAFSLTGKPTTLSRSRVLNAVYGAYDEANPYVLPNYVDPGYVSALTATFVRSRIFAASAGAFDITGLPATFTKIKIYPDPSDVKAGVQYGPGAIYTGTYSGKSIILFDD